MITTIIYDLDGTLINSISDLAYSTNEALRINGFPIHEEEKYNYFVGDGIKELVRRAIPERIIDDSETINRILEEFSKQYDINWKRKSLPYDGISQLLKDLNNLGYKQAVASNKPDFFTKKIISHFFGDNIFSSVYGNTSDTPKKPDPAIIYKITKELGVSLDECIFVGDTKVDIETAKNANVFSVGCLWGFRTLQELRDSGADLIVSHPNEIFQYITNQGKGS